MDRWMDELTITTRGVVVQKKNKKKKQMKGGDSRSWANDRHQGGMKWKDDGNKNGYRKRYLKHCWKP